MAENWAEVLKQEKYVTYYRMGQKVKRVGMYHYPGNPPGPGGTDSGGDFWEGLVDRDTGCVLETPWLLGGLSPGPKVKEETDEKKRFGQSIRRARLQAERYAESNEWDFFLTLTLDKEKMDRQNLDAFARSFSEMCKRIKKDSGEKVRYLTVPELHKDGVSWHMHGIAAIPGKELVQITKVHRESGIYLDGPKKGQSCIIWTDQDGNRIARKQAMRFFHGYEMYRWPRYERNFGYCVVERIRDGDKAKAYCTKMFHYMRKTLENSEKDGEKREGPPAWKVLSKGKHLYYCSRGLSSGERLTRHDGENITAGIAPSVSYDTEYCNISWFHIVRE